MSILLYIWFKFWKWFFIFNLYFSVEIMMLPQLANRTSFRAKWFLCAHFWHALIEHVLRIFVDQKVLPICISNWNAANLCGSMMLLLCIICICVLCELGAFISSPESEDTHTNTHLHDVIYWTSKQPHATAAGRVSEWQSAVCAQEGTVSLCLAATAPTQFRIGCLSEQQT